MTRSTLTCSLIAAFSLSFAVSQGSAAILAQYDMVDNGSGASNTLDTDPDSVASNLTRSGTSFAFGTAGGDGLILANNTNISIQTSNAPTANPTALLATHYLQFNIAPTAGNQIDLTNLRGSFRAEAGSDWTANWAVYYSDDAFVADETLVNNFSVANADGVQLLTMDLSSIAIFTNTLTFRLVPFDGGETSTGRRLRIWDLELNGTVSEVPEPASLALAGLGGLMILGRRRQTA